MIAAARILQLLADPRSGLDITPLVDLGQIGDGHIDLRLGPDVIVSRRVVGAAALDPVDPEAFRRAREDRHQYVRRSLGDSFHLQPGEFAIARSLEYVSLPDDLSAQVLGRSSWGRLGLTVATATLVQPGFGGTITLELSNVSNTPIVLHIGTRVAQLSFGSDSARRSWRVSRRRCERLLERHGASTRHDQGRYLTQLKPELSRIERDKDLAWIAPPPIGYIVGVVGLRYAGKTRVVDFLASQRGFRLYRFVHLLRDEARRRGEDPRDSGVLRAIGDTLCREHGEGHLAVKLWERIRSDLLEAECRREPLCVVVEGFKRPQELHTLGHLAAFRPLVVDCEPMTRVQRAYEELRLRDPSTPPPPEDVPGRRLWLTEQVDETPRDQGAVARVDRLARAWDRSFVVDNAADWGPDTEEQLDRLRSELDALWRAGRLEPEPGLVNAFAGSVELP